MFLIWLKILVLHFQISIQKCEKDGDNRLRVCHSACQAYNLACGASLDCGDQTLFSSEGGDEGLCTGSGEMKLSWLNRLRNSFSLRNSSSKGISVRYRQFQLQLFFTFGEVDCNFYRVIIVGVSNWWHVTSQIQGLAHPKLSRKMGDEKVTDLAFEESLLQRKLKVFGIGCHEGKENEANMVN